MSIAQLNTLPQTANTVGAHIRALLLMDGGRQAEDVRRSLCVMGSVVEVQASESDLMERLDVQDYDLLVLGQGEAHAGADLVTWLRVRHPSLAIVLLSATEGSGPSIDIASLHPIALVPPSFGLEDLKAAVEQALHMRGRMLRRQEGLAAKRGARTQGDAESTSHINQSADFESILSNLYLVYQPIIRARTGCVLGFEALMRSSNARFRGAASLLDSSRRLGRVCELDERVRSLLASEFDSSRHWRTFFVNQDVEELDRGLLGTEHDPLLPYASRIVVDLVGRDLLDIGSRELEAIELIQRAGYRIAVGDHGGGAPLPARLAGLAPAIYKLSGAVVRRADQSRHKQRYMAELVAMAHSQDALVVAQGIERPEERQVAIEAGCDLLQGFLLGMPHAILD